MTLNHRLFSFVVALTLILQVPLLTGAPPEKKSGAASDLVDPKEMLEKLPKSLLKDVEPGSRNRKEAMDDASKQLRESLENKTGTMTFQIRNIDKSNGRYHIMSSWTKERVGGTMFNTHQVIHFAESENEKVMKLKVGDRVTASGKLSASIYGQREALFNVNLGDATLTK